MKRNKKVGIIGVALVGLMALTGCESGASRASDNLSTAADNFEVG